jgi:soluble lytic murein transglycosylase-like protein
VVHYVDRDGNVHEVMVRTEAPAVSALDALAEAEPAPPKEPLPARASSASDELPYAAQVREAAKLYSLPVELILAVIKIESGFNPRAVSRVGAMGLMQLMPRTALEVGVTDPFDPRQNVLGGARYLRILINGYQGDVMLALAGYHAGAGAVGRYGGVPPYPATRKYVAWVLDAYHRYTDGEPR